MTRYLINVCFALATLLIGAPARAAFDSECLIAIQTKTGWSKEHQAKVVFVTGLELSRISSMLPIDFHQLYVVILHEHSLPTVARLDNVLPGVRREFTAHDVARLYASHNDPIATQIAGEGRDLKWRLRGRTAQGRVDEDLALRASAAK